MLPPTGNWRACRVPPARDPLPGWGHCMGSEPRAGGSLRQHSGEKELSSIVFAGEREDALKSVGCKINTVFLLIRPQHGANVERLRHAVPSLAAEALH